MPETTCTICHRECPLVVWSPDGECPHCIGTAGYTGVWVAEKRLPNTEQIG